MLIAPPIAVGHSAVPAHHGHRVVLLVRRDGEGVALVETYPDRQSRNSYLSDIAEQLDVAGVALVQTYLDRQPRDRDSYLSYVAEQLGVEPSDQITSYSACIFAEGPSDVEFWKTV